MTVLLMSARLAAYRIRGHGLANELWMLLDGPHIVATEEVWGSALPSKFLLSLFLSSI